MPDIIGTSCCAIGAPDGSPVTDVVVQIAIVGGAPNAVATGRLTLKNYTHPAGVSLPDTYLAVPVTLDSIGGAIVNVNIPTPAAGFRRCKGDFEFPEQALSGALGEEFFVDSGVTYEGDPATVITGLDHLEGMTVRILADGLVMPDQVVEDGKITLTTAARVVHAGLPYESVLQPMRLDTDPQAGSSQALIKRIQKLSFRLIDTGLPFNIASSVSKGLTPVKNGKAPVTADLFDGEIDNFDFTADYDYDATFIISQSNPLPLTLLGVVVKYQITES